MRKNKIYLVYTILMVTSIIIMIYFESTLQAVSIILLPIMVSIARFIGGIGLIGLFFAGITYFFRFIPQDYRKSKISMLLVRLFIIIILALCIMLSIVEIINLFANRVALNVQNLMTGIFLFIIFMYVVPLWKRKKIKLKEDLILRIKKILGSLWIKIKKSYYYYIVRDYLKAYSIEFLYLKSRLDEYRFRLSWMLLPILIIFLTSIPPLALAVAIAVYRVLTNRANIADKLMISFSLIITPLYWLLIIKEIPTYLSLFWSLSYVLGVFLSLVLFGDALLDILRK